MNSSLFFNTEGPINPSRHYFVDPLERINLSEIDILLDREKYFVLHAPRQTGKTTCLKSLVDRLNSQGRYRACYVNVESGQYARDDAGKAFVLILREIASQAEFYGESRLLPLVEPVFRHQRDALVTFSGVLEYWSKCDPKPLVLVLDEVDALVGDTLIALLRILRTGCDKRPNLFPSSIILCGVRDIRDYRIYSASDRTIITGGSAFNIKSKSLLLGDFSRLQVEELLQHHTRKTGQLFSPESIALIWHLSQGQPWLVNALAYHACFEDKRGLERSQLIESSFIEDAKEALILRRDTHLDQLADKLNEERVRRVVQPILLGDSVPGVYQDDIQYCVDLGLIRKTERGPAIANPIYREVIPRELTVDAQDFLKARFSPDWVTANGLLDVPKLLAQFQEFYLENGEAWVNRFSYREAGPQLLLQAFLQRVTNGKGRIEREYALGTGRTDLCLKWPHVTGTQKAVFELKVLHKSLNQTVKDGLKQVASYADRCNADEAHLLIFDRDGSASIEQRFFNRKEFFQGKEITIWGM